jgi:hypothetical protein
MAVEAQRLTHGIGARWHAVRRRYKWWQLALFVIGVITFVSVLSALFMPLDDKPSRIYTDAPPPPVSDPHFATALGTIVGAPVERGGAITRLNNGDEFVPALLDAIAHAERTINFAVYIWSEGTFSNHCSLRSRRNSARESPCACCWTASAASRCPTRISSRS